MSIEARLQNTRDALHTLLSQYKKICVKNIKDIPVQINRMIFGINKLPLYLQNSETYTINEDDLKYITDIPSYFFSGCTSLHSITIPDGITSIGSDAFANCTSLIDIIMPDSMIEINTYAFSGCSSLTSITIPKNVTYIGGGVLNSCSGITDIYLKPITPPSLIGMLRPLVTYHVPVGSGDAYKSATNWSQYAGRIVEDPEL